MTRTTKVIERIRIALPGISRRSGLLACATLFIALAVLSGCRGNPDVAKQKYLESGKRYLAQGKMREATIEFSNALKIDRNFPEAHYQLGLTLLRMGRLGQAYSEFQHTVDLDPTYFSARIEMADLLIAGGRIDDAQAQANIVLAARPNNPDVHALLSAIAFKRGDRNLAVTEMRHALQLAPTNPSYHESLAFLLSSDPANAAEAESELKKAIVLDPKSANPKLLLMGFYVRTNHLQQAEQEGWSAVATDPKSLVAREDLAQVILKEGDQPRAEQVLRQASHDLADNPQGARVLADYYMSTGQFDKAKTEFAALVAKYHSNLELQISYIRALIQANDLPTARNVLTPALKKNPKNPDLIALNGIMLIDAGKANDAVNALEIALKDNPNDPFLQFWLGKAALANGDTNTAESNFLAVQKSNPAMILAEEALARLAIQQNDMSLLSDVAEKTITAAPGSPAGYSWRSVVDLSHNEFPQAEADLKTAIARAPQNPLGYIELGRLYLTEKHFPEAVALLNQALQLDPNSVDAVRLLVGYNMFEKQPDKAMAIINAQIAKEPRNNGFYDILAQLQLQGKRADLAEASAQKALQINSSDNDAILLFTQSAAMQGHVPNAISAWQKWVSAHPDDAAAYALLGSLEDVTGNRSQAETYYRNALQIQPQQPLAANNLAYIMLQNGENTDVALSLAQIGRQGLPNSPNTADTLGWAYYSKGTYGFARDLIEDAIKETPDDPTVQYHLGMVYGKLKDRTNATLHLKKAISLSPNSPVAKDAQAALNALG